MLYYSTILIGLMLICILLYFTIYILKYRNQNIVEDMYTASDAGKELSEHAQKISSIPLKIKIKNCRRKLVNNLDKSYNSILENYNFLDNEIDKSKEIISCARWILDNMYLIQREYKDIKCNMMGPYYKNLPVIDEGYMKGYPRVYHIAVEMLNRDYGKISENEIENFLNEYQKNTVLTSGELWLFPVMLRIALIRNISRSVENIVYIQKEKNRGEVIANSIINLCNDEGLKGKNHVSEQIEKFKKEDIKFTPSLTEKLIKILRDNFIENPEVYKWIDDELVKQDKTFDMMVNIDHQNQSNYQIVMSNSFNGIRNISSLNWRENFERLSYVEEILKKDPIKLYENMDFYSRDYYRHRIEKLSRKLGISEVLIAKKAVQCAQKAADDKDSGNNVEEYEMHVGYYIIDDGVGVLRNSIDQSKKNIPAYSSIFTQKLYIYTILTVTGVISLIVSYMDIYSESYNTSWKYIITFLVLLIPISEVFISIFNWSISRLTNPNFIPKIEFKHEIPEEYSTIVVIPTLIESVSRLKSLIDELEVYYLSNEEKNLYFAILGDFKDSTSEHEPEDELILKTALNMIKRLNNKYSNGENDKFYFLNRYRKYNEKEEKWIGWERKRGKLMEFNSLIRGDKSTSYNVISGDIKNLYKVKYVITLDADTKLPKDTAKVLVGAMAHVLNKPYVINGKIVRGHGLMQPRVSVGTLSANKTIYSSIFSGDTGIDLYTNAVSDVYEDLFDQGIFTGKGIYDVDIFMNILKDKIPENSVLSHDLLEGSYVRAGLLTDVELIDGYPAYYNSSSKRLHRWVRGDWQLIPWIFKKSKLNGLSRWKIVDNLRRSLLAPFIIMLIFWSIIVFKNPDKGLTIALITLMCPVFFNASDCVVMPSRGISLSGKVDNFKTALEQFLLIFIFLPYKAYLMLDAIIRTLYRLFVSRKHLLQWTTAADVEMNSGKTFYDYIRTMYSGSLIGLFIGILAFYNSKFTGFLMMPSCIVWFLSPYIAYKISMDKKVNKDDLSMKQNNILKEIARRTWAYFEDFVSEETNWLSPDNYQEYPKLGIAYRTSPTNMAMGITSNTAAYDLGYITLDKLQFRLEKIVSNMESLDRFKGHFYNWYDIKSKKPLHNYISTVDSGNLVCYVWLTEETLSGYLKSPILNKNFIRGVYDTINLAQQEIKNINEIKDIYNENINQINEKKEMNIYMLQNFLDDLQKKCDEVLKKYKNLYWNKKLKETLNDFTDFINKYLQWVNDDFYKNSNKQDKSAEIKDILYKVTCDIPVEDIPGNLEKAIDYFKTYSNGDEIEKFRNNLKISLENINTLISKIKDLIERFKAIDDSHDFTVLYDSKRQLFSIGYDADKSFQDKSYYDILASEARQASFIAIAKGQIEKNHWFKLSRSMALAFKEKILVSWSGTMFEYLMPLIIMKSFPGTLLGETYKNVVEVQKSYGKKMGIPWGISECAYYSFDANSAYQYKAIGVPDIGLDRNMANERIVAPYASVMALQVNKKDAFYNIKRLIADGLKGRYGLYESVDYTRGHLEKNKRKIVKCFMIHHQGMSLMSLDNSLNDNIIQKRFHSIPRVKAVELLLQEKMPKTIVYDRREKKKSVYSKKENFLMAERKYTTANTKFPETNIMSNGSYSIMITNSGSGYSKKDEMSVYRWREDSTLDDTGMFFYIKNINSNEYWSAAYEPCKYTGEDYKVVFSEDKAEFERKDGNLKTYTEVTVSQEDDAEIRKISITNNSSHVREVEVTSYLEVTLAPYSADLVHPSFSNLFIETEFLKSPMCLMASRRPRTKGAEKNWLMQTAAVEGTQIGSVQYETSRENFIGRNRDISNPKAMDNDTQLTMTVGAVIDPIISLRVRMKIQPGKTCRIAYSVAVSNSREKIIDLAEKYGNMGNINRIFELSKNEMNMQTQYLGLKASRISMYQIMASRILFLNRLLKDRSKHIMNIQKGQSSLWPYGISGDLPIILLITRNKKDIYLVRQILCAHEYWGLKGLKVDLVILNLEGNSYVQPMQNEINELIDSSHLRNKKNQFGGVFVYNKETMKEEDIELIMAIARLVVDSANRDLFKHIKENEIKSNEIYKNEIKSQQAEKSTFSYGIDTSKLQYFNGLGGFSKQGDSYIIVLKDYNNTPAPWINVISNKSFGFHVSEGGAAYTWNKNSRENKLTSWTNDAVVDGESEAIYIKDEETGRVWSISPKPIRDGGEYVIEHGFGYSNFKHTVSDICGEVTMFVDMDESVKVCTIKLKNIGKNIRKLSLSYYAKLVLGVAHEQTAQYIFTGFEPNNQYIYARNPYSQYFGKLICYLKIIGGEEISYTGNREEFIGRGCSFKDPGGLRKEKLSDEVGAGFDPCLSESVGVTLKPNSEKQLVVLLGQEDKQDNIERIIKKYNEPGIAEKELEHSKEFWREFLGRIQVNTPDKSMNIMLNGWLIYQALSCRYWSRTAFYQSGGAYGFRDQLQDVMAIGYLNPDITRQHIVYSSTRQYLEGDVQHWWHPVVDSGIRTKFSDDLLWLPYVTADYIENTGDYSVLKEETKYLEDSILKENEDERYNISRVSDKKGSVYEHCIKAIDRACKFGTHNIPLMGSGDWNDGMSTVGNKGRGESVWLGWFLYDILDKFIPICNYNMDIKNAERYKELKNFIKDSLEKNAWDGSWYKRAYFDDGTSLGSMENDECRIDCIAQAWAVISKAAKESRAKEALEALYRNLVKKDKGIVLLLTPAFNNSNLEPGYIKGYLPGIRENGGQYTHGAIWSIIAFADMGYNNQAYDIFSMLNPINHSKSYLDCRVYKLEPYVIAADVYNSKNNEGRGGWSWYTGAAGWMYRAGMESILGFKFKGKEGFTVKPCIPDSWKEYSIKYKKDKCIYDIKIARDIHKGIFVDGEKMKNNIIPFLNDGIHKIIVNI